MPRSSFNRNRPAGAWVGLIAGPGLVLAGALALGGSAPAAGEVGVVPNGQAAPVEYLSGDRRAVPLTDQSGKALRSPPGSGLPSPAAAPRPAVPVRLALPRFDLEAQIQPVDVDAAGSLGVPEDPDVLGWWRFGARPGQGEGAVVIDGHVDSARQGLGVFAKLAELDPGDTVGVTTEQGTVRRYVVSGRRLYPKASLPSGEVFSQQGPERLVLISCGGTFDERLRKYSHNVVVYAVPTG